MPKLQTFCLSIIFGLSAALSSMANAATSFEASGSCDVYFSPRGGTTMAIVENINSAKSDIRILAFYFTSKPITQAVIDARKRGVAVYAVLDRNQPTARGNKIQELVEHGVQLRIDAKHRIMHNKVIIIDELTVITGSFNFSAAAESSNAENTLVCQNANQARVYRENWDHLWELSVLPKDAPVQKRKY